jgi:hypothetical protein
MAIGPQKVDGHSVSADELKLRYDDLIKEAILKARPDIEVTRADEVSLPGTITTDIITRLMHSDFVVADVTFPNPNVFYELGLRHACRPGTIIIKDKNGPSVPFDIAHLRYIEYENTASGLKTLAEQFHSYFSHFSVNPNRPDNHFLELAKLTEYEFPSYAKADDTPPETKMVMALFESPELMQMMLKQQQGAPLDQAEVIHALMANPKVAEPLLNVMVKSGDLSFDKLGGPKPNRKQRRAK